MGHLHDVGASLRVVISINRKLIEVSLKESGEGRLILDHVSDLRRLVATSSS